MPIIFLYYRLYDCGDFIQQINHVPIQKTSFKNWNGRSWKFVNENMIVHFLKIQFEIVLYFKHN